MNAIEYLKGFTKSGKPVSDLSRASGLMAKLGNPQKLLKLIHIAGTNGKGSTAQFISEILTVSGYKTGTFTSPFMLVYNDRMRINGENISDERLGELCERVSKVVDGDEGYSQFEISQAIAFCYFVEEGCDVVVLEAGIGGLCDSTNIIEEPLCTVITSVSFDHTQILGETIEEIARQKAGIIKPLSPCVMSMFNCAKAVEAVKRVADEKNSELIIPNSSLLTEISCTINGSVFDYDNARYSIKMAGRHQIVNACTAISVVKLLCTIGFDISKECVKKGLGRAKIPLRAEVVSENPLVLIDGAHNPDGMRSLAELIEGENFEDKSLTAVIGMLNGKDARRAVRELVSVRAVGRFICAEGFHPSELSADELAELINSIGGNAIAVASCEVAVEDALGASDKILICGSLYLCTSARRLVLEKLGK